MATVDWNAAALTNLKSKNFHKMNNTEWKQQAGKKHQDFYLSRANNVRIAVLLGDHWIELSEPATANKLSRAFNEEGERDGIMSNIEANEWVMAGKLRLGRRNEKRKSPVTNLTLIITA